MAEKFLKSKKQKIAPAKPTVEEPKKVVLVGTYANTQLTDYMGFYVKNEARRCGSVNVLLKRGCVWPI